MSENKKIIVVDKLSLGSVENIDLSQVIFHHVDINEFDNVLNLLCHEANIEEVWHLAANSDIPAGVKEMDVDLSDTFMSTVSVLKNHERR